MFKIKLLILLLSSVFILSCSADQKINQVKLSVGYIGGEYDGLLLQNQLRSHLNNLSMLDEKSKYQIQCEEILGLQKNTLEYKECSENKFNFHVYNIDNFYSEKLIEIQNFNSLVDELNKFK